MSLFEIYYKDKWEFKNLELTLSRIDDALRYIGFNPKKLGKIVHISGTNGKGSTSFFLSQILEKNGFKTALFTSPHIADIKERMSLNLSDIQEDDFNRLFNKYQGTIVKFNLSYFEGLFLLTMAWFIEMEPDITILETGLGGTFDATNTSTINDKICVITSISQDHSDLLGHNIYGIIGEKLGIVRKNSQVFLGINKEFVKNYIINKIENKIIGITTSNFGEKSYPRPFSENYSTAKTVADYIIGKTTEDYGELHLPPCRLEKHGNIILDGSHNQAGLMALKKSGMVGNNPYIIFTSTKERPLSKIFPILSKFGTRIILTTIPDNPRSISEDDAKNIDCIFIKEPKEAFIKASIEANGSEILVTGSFYLCAYIKKAFLV